MLFIFWQSWGRATQTQQPFHLSKELKNQKPTEYKQEKVE